MNTVTLTVGGRPYTVSCAPGEEARIRELGTMIDARLQRLGVGLSHNDAKHLLLVSLILADELDAATPEAPAANGADVVSDELAQLRAERDALRKERDSLKLTVRDLAEETPKTLTFGVAANRELERQNRKLANDLEGIAESLEQSADALEKAAGTQSTT